MKYAILIINFIFVLGSCQTKSDTKNIEPAKSQDCKIFYQKFKQAVIEQKSNGAIIQINNAINGNPKNYGYKNSKLRFLISIGKYEDAISTRRKLDSPDKSMEFLKAVLKLKINDSGAITLLRKSYQDFKSQEINSDTLLYKVALTNFFENKDIALREIEEYNINLQNYIKRNLKVLESLIKAKNKDEVLYGIFGIQ